MPNNLEDLLKAPESIDLLGVTLKPIRADGAITGAELEYGKEDTPVHIYGSLVHQKQLGALFGSVVVKAMEVTVDGDLVFEFVDGPPSICAVATVTTPLGGPPSFFITGAKGGVGLNRSFIAPQSPADVPNFSLVKTTTLTPQTLAKAFKAEKRSHWLAAGVDFISYGFLRGEALLVLKLSSSPSLTLLGTLTLDLPPTGVSLAKIVCPYVAVVSRSEVSATAAVDSDKSFILGSVYKVSGGLAFKAFLKEGGAVFTVGGYHPAFQRPANYPDVGRLSVSANLGYGVTATGEVYLALTTREAMCGGSLNIQGEWGPAYAWFTARCDAWLGWNPFFLRASVEVEVGVGVSLFLFDAELSVSVTLEIWAPDFGGRAEIDLDIVSFSLTFGKEAKEPKLLNANEFIQRHATKEAQ